MPGTHELIEFAGPDQLAAEAARRWMAELARLSGTSLAAVSGGRIAGNFFRAIAGQATDSLRSVEWFWADERCVPGDDPESNFALANANLFQPAKLDPARIHRIEGELEPPAAAEKAEMEIRTVSGFGNLEIPILDWVFLGMGEDGHVASLFPEEDETSRQSPALFRPVVATKPPPNRITMGYNLIAAARQVWVLASGAGKAEMLRAALAQESDTPLARVLNQRERTVIFSAV